MKTLLFMRNDAAHGGEGSRGGKIIGRTKSGKPIYNKHGHPGHKDFTAADHQAAIWADHRV